MKLFFTLIDRLNAADTEERHEIERFIWESFAQDMTVLALDMSSFSMSVRRNGIVSHLCQIRRMHLLTEPVVKAAGGSVVKYESDNMLAVFDEPIQAVTAAIEINRAVASSSEANAHVPPLAVSIGIDCGQFLVLADEDCFGDPVNVAFKLGEDVAGPGEVLITERVRDRLPAEAAYRFESVKLSLAGVEVPAYRVAY